MKQLIIVMFSLVVFMTLFAIKADAASRVRGYTTSRGTYVQPYYRSSSDSFKWNNYSAQGNYNPYTGRRGYSRW